VVAIFSFELATFLMVAVAEVLSQERVRLWTMVPVLFLAGVNVAIAFLDPASSSVVTYPSGEIIVEELGWGQFIMTILALYAEVFLLITYVRIYKHAPPSLRKYSRMFPLLVAATLIGLFIESFKAISAIFIAISNLLSVFVGVWMMWIIIKASQLGFILPFKVNRLTVLNTESGIPIFDHAWGLPKNAAEDGLYGGMLQGVRMILKESIGKGDLKEITLAQAVLISRYDEASHLGFILLATKVTKTLRQALDYFSKQFLERFGGLVDTASGEVSKFDGATEIVKNVFTFVPEDEYQRP
jgi:hypothetical protein